jgi:hypothetical protein
MKYVLAFLFFLLVLTGTAEAGTSITLSPDPGHNNQDQINEALKNYDTVFLEEGVYEVSEKIIINTGNTLTGSEDAIIRVWSGSSLWFIYNYGIITGNGCSNIEISNIQIDGNCDELPESYSGFSFPGGSGVHNTEKAISISGHSDPEKGFIRSIWIYNVKIYDCFSDGIRVAYADYVFIYDNYISNCQHEGVYFVCVRYGIIQNCVIEGITSDCVRLDNGQNCIIRFNVLDSYTGDHNNGAYKEGHQGIQAGDQGRSFNSGSNQPLKTTNIEIYGNIFTGKKRMNIWIDASDKGVINVFVHDNDFQEGKAVETTGTPVKEFSDIDGSTDSPTRINRDIPQPSDVYKVIMRGFSFMMVEKDLGASAKVTFNNISYDPHSLIEVKGDELKLIKFEYGGNTTRYFIEKDLWIGEIQHIGEDLYLSGNFDIRKLNITAYSESGYQKVTDIKVIERTLSGAASINPDLFIFITILIILGISIARNIRRIFE